MDSRGTGLKQNKPPGWETGSHINFGGSGPNASPQGAAKGPAVTSRSMQAPIPGEVVNQMDAGGGFISQVIAGRPGMEAERSRSGGDGNVVTIGAGMSGAFPPAGKGSGGGMVSKPGVMGRTSGGEHFGSSKGGF